MVGLLATFKTKLLYLWDAEETKINIYQQAGFFLIFWLLFSIFCLFISAQQLNDNGPRQKFFIGCIVNCSFKIQTFVFLELIFHSFCDGWKKVKIVIRKGNWMSSGYLGLLQFSNPGGNGSTLNATPD